MSKYEIHSILKQEGLFPTKRSLGLFLKPISLSFLLLVFVKLNSFGQENFEKRTSVFFELAGSGGLGSFNFERHFRKVHLAEFTWRAGLSFAPIDRNNGVGIVIPVMANALIGKTSHKLELGLGQGITITTKGSFFTLTTLAIGYRYQSQMKPWFFRVTYTPLISYLVDFQVQQWGGLSVGYSFIKTKK